METQSIQTLKKPKEAQVLTEGQPTRHDRAARRQAWRKEWKAYTHPNAEGSRRPQSLRRVRRQDWRDEWKEGERERKQGASTEGEII